MDSCTWTAAVTVVLAPSVCPCVCAWVCVSIAAVAVAVIAVDSKGVVAVKAVTGAVGSAVSAVVAVIDSASRGRDLCSTFLSLPFGTRPVLPSPTVARKLQRKLQNSHSHTWQDVVKLSLISNFRDSKPVKPPCLCGEPRMRKLFYFKFFAPHCAEDLVGLCSHAVLPVLQVFVGLPVVHFSLHSNSQLLQQSEPWAPYISHLAMEVFPQRTTGKQ